VVAPNKLRLFDRRNLMLEINDALTAIPHSGVSFGRHQDCGCTNQRRR
jgi:hypothetical protein